jgi:hypothetical protein
MYFSQYFIWMIKLSRTRWAGHVACIEKRNAYGILVGQPEEGDHLEAPDIDGRIHKTVSVGTTQNGVKFGTVRSRIYCSYRHMARAIQKVSKLAENKMQEHKIGVLLYFLKIS